MHREEFNILRYISEHGHSLAQSQIAEATDCSGPRVAQVVGALKQRGYLNESFGITAQGIERLEPYRVKNAIILAAGLGTRFLPVSWEVPKGLLRVKGHILIERLIEQLREAGIKEIVVVVGAMLEKFTYLRDKYNVKFVINNEYSIKNTHSSIYWAREYLGNSYIICADNFYPHNLFHQYEYRSFYCSIFMPGIQTTERGLTLDAEQRIISTNKPARDQWIMYGHAYLDDSFTGKFIPFLVNFWNRTGAEDMYWETIWAQDVDGIPLWSLPCEQGDILEFDSMAELKAFDPDFLRNNNIRVFENICNVLKCEVEDIQQIEPINKGLTNHKFKFRVKARDYIYRHPGINSILLIDRQREERVLREVKKAGLANSLIDMDVDEGWMISKFINETETFEPGNSKHLELLSQKLKLLHETKICSGLEYNYQQECDKILTLLKNVNPEAFHKALLERELMLPVFEFLENDMWQVSLCHNDIFAENILVENDSLELIDWEYGGDADIGFDICKLFGMTSLPLDDVDRWLFPYYKRKTTYQEKRHLYACTAVCYYRWFVWGLFMSVRNQVEINDIPLWYKKMITYRNMALHGPVTREM